MVRQSSESSFTPSLSRNTETHNSFEKVLDRVGVDVFAVDGSA